MNKKYIKAIFVPVLFFLILPAAGYAQEGFKIQDLISSEPLPGANARNIRTGEVYIADLNGWVTLPSESKMQSFEISFVGYQKRIFRFNSAGQEVFLEPDYNLLEGVEVIGYESTRRITEIAGGFAFLPNRELTRFNDATLVHAMNTLPGIRMEERAPGSYRINIRGSSLRSPFGVRNVKVYWNDIPFTEPTGSTPINLMDLNNIDRIEVIKGPGASIYGAGIGGVINLSGLPLSRISNQSEVSYSGGSYGFHRFTANGTVQGEKHLLSIRFASLKTDGYREQSALDRKTLQIQGNFDLNEKQNLSLFLLYSDLYYQLPGGLTLAEFEANPRMARPNAARQRSSIDNQNLLIGLSHDIQITENFSNTTSIYMSDGHFENPFILNYKQDRFEGIGGRTRFNYHTDIGSVATRWVAGGEYQWNRNWTRNYGNVNGRLDSLRFEDYIIAVQGMAFAQVEADLPGEWIATLGGSLNYVNYDIDRVFDAFNNNPFLFTKSFQPVFSPRISLLKKLNRQISAHASVSYGFSPPTSLEVRTNEGSINEDLEAEKGINYEIGIRGNAFANRLRFDISAFLLQQTETIVSRASEVGTIIFENSGATSQRGLEVLFAETLIDNPSGFISRLATQQSITINHFRFTDYITNTGDFTGNMLTGTPANFAALTADLDLRPGFYINGTLNYSDRIPLNDGNTVFADPFHLINLKAGFRRNIAGTMQWELFAGVENLLNEKYSLGNDLNAFGGRFFSPAPDRNYYAGIKILFNHD